MKLTLNNIKEIKRTTTSELEKDVCNYVINEWSNYNDKKSIFTDVIYHGCQSGMVGHLIYYSDTIKYYKKHKEEINELLYKIMSEFGSCSFKDIFGNKFDEEDPLINYDHNQNLMAWFGFEETMRNIALKFKELESCI